MYYSKLKTKLQTKPPTSKTNFGHSYREDLQTAFWNMTSTILYIKEK